MDRAPALGQSRRQIICNGGMDFFQRSVSVNPVTNATYTYLADRFSVYENLATGAMRCDKDTSTPSSDRVSNALKIQPTTLQASVAAGEYGLIRYCVEGSDYLPISKGKNITLSFWVKSSLPGIYCISFYNGASNRFIVKEYTISSIDWEKKYIQIATDTVGTWSYDNSAGMYIQWTLASGVNFQGAKDAWGSSGIFATSNQTNFFSSTSNTFYLTGVMLYEGWTENSGFYRAGRTIQEELALCQRYYENSADLGVVASTDYQGSMNIKQISIPFKVNKRTTPTISTTSDSTTTTGTTSMAYTIGGVGNYTDGAVSTRKFSNFTFNMPQVNTTIANRLGWTADAEF